jgi:hypothetical protein
MQIMLVSFPSLLLFSLLQAQDSPVPKFPLGKDTTYVTGPLDKEGYVDYQAAVNERLAKGITPNRNANVLLWMALGPAPAGADQGMPAEFFTLLGMGAPPKEGEYFIGLQAFCQKHHDWLYEGRISADRYWVSQRPWRPDRLRYLIDWLNHNEKPFALAIEASRRPEYFNPLVSRRHEGDPRGMIVSLLPGVAHCQEMAWGLTARAMLRLEQGKLDDAWSDLLACHRLARLIGRGATVIETLAAIYIEETASRADLTYLERAGLGSQQILDRLNDLQELSSLPPLADKVDLAERMTCLDLFQLGHRCGFSSILEIGNGDTPVTPANTQELHAMDLVDWHAVLTTANNWYDRMSAALRQANRAERKAAYDKLEQEMQTMKKTAVDIGRLTDLLASPTPPFEEIGKSIGALIPGIFVPAIGKAQKKLDRVEQVRRNLHIAFALAAYRGEHGRYPPTLADLEPTYITTVRDDLFSGEGMIYRPDQKGYLLYSIGENEADDGGRGSADTPAGDDIVVRMPLPNLPMDSDRFLRPLDQPVNPVRRIVAAVEIAVAAVAALTLVMLIAYRWRSRRKLLAARQQRSPSVLDR